MLRCLVVFGGKLHTHCQLLFILAQAVVRIISTYRDRVPFVLTPDMAYVINDGDSLRFRRFVELCCGAYNELRRHSSLFLSLLSLVQLCIDPSVHSALLCSVSPSTGAMPETDCTVNAVCILLQMLSNNMPELASADDIQYVRDALMVGRTENEATYAFTKCVCWKALH